MKCSNTKCSNTFRNGQGFETGTPSGYADDYVFCKQCAPLADKHFTIAGYHDGGMIAAPECEGRFDDPTIPHTCPFTEEERNEAKEAFKNYR